MLLRCGRSSAAAHTLHYRSFRHHLPWFWEGIHLGIFLLMGQFCTRVNVFPFFFKLLKSITVAAVLFVKAI